MAGRCKKCGRETTNTRAASLAGQCWGCEHGRNRRAGEVQRTLQKTRGETMTEGRKNGIERKEFDNRESAEGFILGVDYMRDLLDEEDHQIAYEVEGPEPEVDTAGVVWVVYVRRLS